MLLDKDDSYEGYLLITSRTSSMYMLELNTNCLRYTEIVVQDYKAKCNGNNFES